MSRKTVNEFSSEQITEALVSHLFQSDDEFRIAIIKHVAQNGIKNDPSLRKIFKEKTHSVMNKVFGFRNRSGNALAAAAKKEPKKDKKEKEAPKPVKKPKKNVASSNRFTHEEAIVNFLGKHKAAASAQVIANGLSKMDHKIGGQIISELSKLKAQGVLATKPHQGKEPRVIYDWTLAAP
jgi:hypothetical protein